MKCLICGKLLSKSQEGLKAHVRRCHGQEVAQTYNHDELVAMSLDRPIEHQTIRPIKLTSRTTREIVRDFEWCLGEALIPQRMPWAGI